MELINYNADTGLFTWKPRKRSWFKNDKGFKIWNTRWSFAQAGGFQNHSGKTYASIRVMYKRYLAHRLAWLYVYGEWPPNEIDHIDGNGANNAISNLRAVDSLENNKNMRLRSDNTSGKPGVWWCKSESRWRVEIMVNKKKIHIGSFTDKNKAIEARCKADIGYGFHKNHGETRPL